MVVSNGARRCEVGVGRRRLRVNLDILRLTTRGLVRRARGGRRPW